MPCYRPLDAFQCVDGAVVFSEGKGNKRYDISRSLQLACGQCVGCRLERSRQWAVRCTHEKQLHEEACFLTLTYNDDSLPYGNTLAHGDVQLFIKKLRRHVVRNLPKSKLPKTRVKRQGLITHSDEPAVDNHSPNGYAGQNRKAFFEFPRRKANLPITYIRYYMCGEYGDKTHRAHYHMCLYGWDPKDKAFHTISGSKIKSPIYTSKTLDKIWGLGHCYAGELTFESAAYTARYIMKKVTGQAAANHYERLDAETGEILKRQPEYTRMSLKPGIGAGWMKKFQSDAYPEGTVLVRGHKSKAPKYYDKLFKRMKPLDYEDLLFEREKVGIKNATDNTKERLAVKETVAKAQIAFLKRNAN